MMNYECFGMVEKALELNTKIAISRVMDFMKSSGSSIGNQRPAMLYYFRICFPGSNEL